MGYRHWLERSCLLHLARPGGKEFHRLTIAKDGSGGGTVTSVPAGINCGSDCTEAYEKETVVTLTANPDPGTVFAGWSVDGGCPVAGDYQLTLIKDTTITAIFINLGNFTKVTMVFPNGGETLHPTRSVWRSLEVLPPWNRISSFTPLITGLLGSL